MKKASHITSSIDQLAKVAVGAGRDLGLKLLESIDKLPAAQRGAVLVVLLCCVSGQSLEWKDVIGALLHQAV